MVTGSVEQNVKLLESALLDASVGSGIFVTKYSTVLVSFIRFNEASSSCSKLILIVELPFLENVGPARGAATPEVDNIEIVTVPAPSKS